MQKITDSIFAFIGTFPWTLAFLGIVVLIQFEIASERISGYPANLWSSYFVNWWIYTAPVGILGVSMVLVGQKIGQRRFGLASKCLGRIVVFVVILSHYISLLAIG
jgi:hypothetical protein